MNRSAFTLRALALLAVVGPSIGRAAEAPRTQTAPLAFSEAYELIQKRNLNVGTQRLNVEIAQAKKLSAVGAFTPSLNLVASDDQAHGTWARAAGSPEDLRSARLAVSANLFRSGTDFAALKAANRAVEASEESLGDQRLKAEDDAATTLFTLISRTAEREFVSQIVGLKTESVKIARERFNHGLLPQQEVDKTQIDLDNAQARLIDAEVALSEARAAVNARLGSAQAIRLEWPWKTTIVSDRRPDVDPFKFENRPDYRSALKTLEAQEWLRHASRAALLPSLDVNASYGNFDLSQADRRDWTLGLTLTVPIFEKFVGWSEARIQSLAAQQAEIERERVARTANAEVESFTVGYRAARESAVAREKTSKLTSRLYNDNLQRFRLGRASANDLSLDQNRLLEAQILEVQGWTAAHLSLVRLCHALGRSIRADGVCQAL